MPPSQMRSSVCSISSKNRLSPVRSPARQSSSNSAALGNFGAPRRPPWVGSNAPPICRANRSSSCAPITTLPAGRAWLGEPRHQRVAVLADLVRLLAKQPRNLAQHVDEGRPAVARGFREIRAAPDRLALRRQEHGQRPAALLAQMMQRRHVDLVDVGALLAVDFDVDEQLVHHRRGGVVLEALVRHDVAPVAGGVADREQDRLAGALAPRQRLRPPRPPVHRIVLVLQQIRAGLARQAVFRARAAELVDDPCAVMADFTTIGCGGHRGSGGLAFGLCMGRLDEMSA